MSCGCDVRAGGLKALVGDAEELRKAVEFGTACGAFVTQVRTNLMLGRLLQ